MSKDWYALRVKPHKERAVSRLLQSRDIQMFFPTLRVKPVNPRSAKEKPYFPGYLFIKANLSEMGKNAFSWIQGTHGLVVFGGIPAVVPERLINDLQAKLTELNAQQPGRLQVKKGESVRIVSGPFAGYEAIFDAHLPGSERVQVLLAFLSNYPQTLKLDESDIEKK